MAIISRLDRLSAVLEGLAPQVNVGFAGAIEAPIALGAGKANFLRIHLVTDGSAKLALLQGQSEDLAAPSIAVLRSDCGHILAPSQSKSATSVMCMEAGFDGPVAKLLLEAFTEPLLLRLAQAESELNLVVRLITHELTQPRCGHPALLARAADILLIGLLRHLLAHPRLPAGLLSGLADQRIARALVAVHSAPHMPWTLDTMAQEAGMSRTAFANHFRDTMRHTPGNYLMRLRLSIAHRAMDGGQGLKQAARQAGYASTTALSRALGRQQVDLAK
jgi:AraC-like DNA-binding protein